MNLFGWLKEWINERGSASIMEKRLALKDDEIAQLKAKIKDLEITQKKEQIEADEIRIHNGIEFRNGKRTSEKWAAFCPKCHLPADQIFRSVDRGKNQRVVICSARCGWFIFMQKDIEDLIAELKN